jgi:NAD(P)-dependent dehydrogenase (short-subunit alcohol dehydrogenase family)
MARLVGKTGLVVDASSRLGRPAALALAREGARVFVGDRDARSGAETVAAIEREGGTADRVLLDPLDPTSSDRAVAEVIERFGRLDVLCNPPAPVPTERKLLHELSESEWDAAMAACITCAIVPARSALRAMKEHGGGSVIFVVSAAALVGVPLLSAFSAAEGVLVNLTRGLARDGASRCIRVNCVCLGSSYDQILQDERDADATPVPAEEIAPVIAFLASNESRHVTGHILAADDGLTAWRSERRTA